MPNEAPVDDHRGPIEAHLPFEALPKILLKPIEAPVEAHRGPSRPYRDPYRCPSKPYRASIEAHRGPIEIQRGPSRSLSRSTEPYRGPSALRALIEVLIDAHRGPCRGPSSPSRPHRDPYRDPSRSFRGHIEIQRGFIEAHGGPTRSISTAIEALSKPIAPSRPYRRSYRGPSRPLPRPIEAHRGPIETPIEDLSRSIEALLGRIGTQRGPYRRPPRLYRGPSPHRGLIEAPIEALVQALVEALSRPYRGPIETPIEAHRGPIEALSRSIEVY
jgi:hypothetical protein